VRFFLLQRTLWLYGKYVREAQFFDLSRIHTPSTLGRPAEERRRWSELSARELLEFGARSGLLS